MKSNQEYKPLPFRPGNTILKKYTVDFDDGHGHKALITKADFKNKKGKTILGHTLYVRWL